MLYNNGLQSLLYTVFFHPSPCHPVNRKKHIPPQLRNFLRGFFSGIYIFLFAGNKNQRICAMLVCPTSCIDGDSILSLHQPITTAYGKSRSGGGDTSRPELSGKAGRTLPWYCPFYTVRLHQTSRQAFEVHQAVRKR